MTRARHHKTKASVPSILHVLAARASAAVPRHTGPMLSRSQLTSLGLAHIGNVELLTSGAASAGVMWQWAEGVLTWSYAACVLGVGEVEMGQQLRLATAVIQRYRLTSAVTLEPAEVELAKTGAQVCDALAAQTTVALAMEATLWSEAQVLSWTSVFAPAQPREIDTQGAACSKV